MIWSSVRISSNTFKQNAGWFSTYAAIQAIWYTDGKDGDFASTKDHQVTPSSMSSTLSDNLSKQGIVSFSTVNTITLPSSTLTMDSNKILMQSNTFNQNFICAGASIVLLQNLRRLFIDSDTYINNSGQYLEALNYYGSITSTGTFTDVSQPPGALSLSAYYEDSNSSTSLQSIVTMNSLENYYPIAPLIINGALYISAYGLTFDNNAMQELNPTYVKTTYPSNAITFLKNQGVLTLKSFTIQNYKGFDLAKIQEILGTTAYANVVYKLPTERDSSGSSSTTVSSPSYVIDYAFKSTLIKFGYPPASSNSDFQNYFDKLTIDLSKLSNITHYCPGQSIPIFLELNDDWTDVTITNFDIKNVDLVYGREAIFKISNYGTLTIQNGTVDSLNVNSYNYDTSGYTYVGNNGGIFSFYSVSKNSKSDFVYTVTNVTFTKLYGNEGAAIYFVANSGVTTAHPNYITLSTLTLTSSYSYKSGLVYLASGLQFVSITGSTFTSNTGVTGEADLFVVSSGSLTVTSTTFTLFASSSTARGASISFTMSLPFSFQATFSSITIKWNSDSFVSATFKNYADNPTTYLTKNSPIQLSKGSLKTTSSTFSNCAISKNGGILYIESGSIYTDIGSTFTQNAANDGGAIYISGGTLSLLNTVLSYNYADDGGAIYGNSLSVISQFSGITWNYNYVSDSGGWLYLIGSSKIVADTSTFSNNKASNTASAVYFLGTDTSTFATCTFSSNYAISGNTLSLLFAPTTFTSITISNNLADADSSGIFITFSIVTISSSTFNTTSFPNSETSSFAAADSAKTTGWYISISAGASVTVSNSNFENGYAINGGFIYMAGNSDLTISGSTFKSGSSKSNGGSIYASSFNKITISSSSFTNSASEADGSVFYFNSGTTSITSIIFSLTYNPSAIYLLGGTFAGNQITMTNSIATNTQMNSNYYGSGIFASNMNSFSLSSSTFTSLNYAGYGGAIYISDTSSSRTSYATNPTYSINSWTFTSNSAYYGGAVYVDYVKYASFTSWTFTSNSAISSSSISASGSGGAIYYASAGKKFILI